MCTVAQRASDLSDTTPDRRSARVPWRAASGMSCRTSTSHMDHGDCDCATVALVQYVGPWRLQMYSLQGRGPSKRGVGVAFGPDVAGAFVTVTRCVPDDTLSAALEAAPPRGVRCVLHRHELLHQSITDLACCIARACSRDLWLSVYHHSQRHS